MGPSVWIFLAYKYDETMAPEVVQEEEHFTWDCKPQVTKETEVTEAVLWCEILFSFWCGWRKV